MLVNLLWQAIKSVLMTSGLVGCHNLYPMINWLH
jgi:hypothetical protein